MRIELAASILHPLPSQNSLPAFSCHVLNPRQQPPQILTKTEDAGFNRSRTVAAGLGKDGGERILRCVGSPACVAKNRYDLPAELPLSCPGICLLWRSAPADQL